MRRKQSKQGRLLRGALLSAALLLGTATALAAEEAGENEYPVYVDGEQAEIAGYLIDGSSYFRLRDIGDAVGFGVDWDEETRSIRIDTAPLHAGEASLRSRNDQLSLENGELRAGMEQLTLENREMRGRAQLLEQVMPENEALHRRSRQYQTAALCILAAALLLVLFGAVYYQRRVRHPLRLLRELAEHWPETDAARLRELALSVRGAPRAAAQAFLGRMEQMEAKLALSRAESGKDAEERCTRRVTGELLRGIRSEQAQAALPPELPVDIAEMAEPEDAAAGVLYDRFLAGGDRVFLLIGQADGEGVQAGFRAALARNAMQSFIRAGLTLEDAVKSLNAWLLAREERFELRMLAGMLDLADGSFTWINAGGRFPLLKHHGGPYEWLKTRAGSALGTHEADEWKPESLMLRKGDRIFLHTEGIDNGRDREGIAFSEKGLRAALNQSREKTETAEDALRFVVSKAAAHCEREAERQPYAVLMLEYTAENRELTYSELPASPKSAGELTEFLKRRFELQGIPRRAYAGLAVLADELFALCCRYCRQDRSIRTECEIDAKEGRVELRMSAPMNGINPLEETGNLASQTASEFILTQAKEVRFSKGQTQDMLVLLYELGKSIQA